MLFACDNKAPQASHVIPVLDREFSSASVVSPNPSQSSDDYHVEPFVAAKLFDGDVQNLFSEKWEVTRPGNGGSIKSADDRAVTLKNAVNHLLAQLVLLLALACDCLGYLGWYGGNLIHVIISVFLSICALFELITRVWADGGPINKLRSWARWQLPGFHKFEAFAVLLVCTVAVRRLWYARYGDDGRDLNPWKDMSIFAVHRMVRLLSLYFNISVRQTEAMMDEVANKDWSVVRNIKKENDKTRIMTRVQRKMDSMCAQVIFCTIFAVHSFWLVGEHFTPSEQHNDMTLISGWLVISILLSELIVRTAAFGCEAFFGVGWHLVETMFWLVGLNLSISVIFHREHQAEAIGGIIFLMLYRSSRFIGTSNKVSASSFQVKSLLDAKLGQVFLKRFGHIIAVPPENITLEISDNITVKIYKAKLRSEAFEGLHLPIVPIGGLLEEIIVTATGFVAANGLPSRAQTGCIRVRLRNLVFLCGPTKSLGDVACRNGKAMHWAPDVVRDCKSRLVDFLCQPWVPWARLAAGPTDPKNVFDLVKRHISDIKKSYLRDVGIDIQKVTLQFQDTNNRLALKPSAIHFSVSRVKVERNDGRLLRCVISRINFAIETAPGIVNDSVTAFPSKSVSRLAATWKWRLEQLLEEDVDPEMLVKEINRQNVCALFRETAIDSFLSCLRTPRQQHNYMERWVDTGCVCRLSQASFAMGTEQVQAPSGTDAHATNSNQLSCHPSRHGADHVKSEPWYHRHRTQADPSSPKIDVPRWLPRFRVDRFHEEKQPDLEKATHQKLPVEFVWRYSGELTPLSVAIDDSQLSCVEKLLQSFKAWWILDACFRLRPDVTLGELKRKEHPRALSSVVRLWWNYAFHAVLARLRMKLSVSRFSVKMREENYKSYKDLLQEVALRGPQCTKDNKFSLQLHPHELAAMKDMQLHLPLKDIVICRRHAFNLLRRGLRARQSIAFFQEVRMTKSTANAVNSQPVGGVNQQHHQPQNRQQLIARIAGLWELHISSFELRLLRDDAVGLALARSRIIVANLKGFWLTMEIRPRVTTTADSGSPSRDEAGPLDGKPSLVDGPSLALCVESFEVFCPDRCHGSLCYRGGNNIFCVTRYVQLPLSTEGGYLAPSSGRHDVAFVMRAVLSSSSIGKCEVHSSSFRFVLYEPLYDLLIRFTTKPKFPTQNLGNVGDDLRISSMPLFVAQTVSKPSSLAAEDRDETKPVRPFNLQRRRVGPTSVKMQDGLVGKSTNSQLGQAATVEKTQLCKSKRERKKKNSAMSRLLKKVGLHEEVEIDILFGAIDLMQVGELSQRDLLVEVLRIRPWTCHSFNRPAPVVPLRNEMSRMLPTQTLWQEVSKKSRHAEDDTRPYHGIKSGGIDEDTVWDWQDPRWPSVENTMALARKTVTSSNSPRLDVTDVGKKTGDRQEIACSEACGCPHLKEEGMYAPLQCGAKICSSIDVPAKEKSREFEIRVEQGFLGGSLGTRVQGFCKSVVGEDKSPALEFKVLAVSRSDVAAGWLLHDSCRWRASIKKKKVGRQACNVPAVCEEMITIRV
eukprot:TRINITY_DN34678_c0_g1_i1.p1 TRINITY_DN34678_c0_g1~~TRINITY_DN34678_c0_g1_i1.p1  ORF type:complete len:1540 (-),score=193.84 TRINITY_DN34678_c0_g1_i1:150-4769(-)